MRPSTPEDMDAKIVAALGKLNPDDRKLATTQKFCPILESKLGSMGVPVKVMLDGQPVFVCCKHCVSKAQDDPSYGLAQSLGDSREAFRPRSDPIPKEMVVNRFAILLVAGAFVFAGCNDAKSPPATAGGSTGSISVAKSKTDPGKLTKEDEALVKAQKVCPISGDELGGAMGPPVKVMLKGQPVFLCCKGCVKDAEKDPEGTLKKVAEFKKKGNTLLAPQGSRC